MAIEHFDEVLCTKANKLSITEMFKELRVEIKDRVKEVIEKNK